MTDNKKLYNNHQIEIKHLIKLYSNLEKYNNTAEFDNFVNIYGKTKVIEILNNHGFKLYNIAPKFSGNILDEINQNLLNKVYNKAYNVKKLYSKYYYQKYKKALHGNQLIMQNTQVLFNCLATKDVNIKKTYSVAEINNLIKKQQIVLLDVKEREVNTKNYFSKNLLKVHKEFIATVDNYSLQKNIFPSIKYLDNQNIYKNLDKYMENPSFKQEYIKVTKQILKTLLVYELQNQQILLTDGLEKAQNTMIKLAYEYKSVAKHLGEKLALNQKLLSSLQKTKKSQIEDFVM